MLQLTAAFAAAVNGGSLYKPHLMRRIVNALGETVCENQPFLIRRVIKPSPPSIVNILRQVVSTGTGKAAAIKAHDVVGKTEHLKKRIGRWILPGKIRCVIYWRDYGRKPRLVVFVLIDEPENKNRTGGKASAPVFRKIGEGILALCGSNSKDPEIVFESPPVLHGKSSQASQRSVLVRRDLAPAPG